MMIEQKGSPEVSKTPETVEEMMAKYFSYPDVGTTQEIMNRVEHTFALPNARKYAGALMELAEREGMQNILDLADTMKKAMLADAGRLNMPISPFGRDRSWAMWDLGKQYYYSKPEHQAEATEEYRDDIADPMDAANIEASDRKKLEIVNRRLGWEGRRAYSRNIGKWKEEVDSHEDDYILAVELLQKNAEKPDGQLHSHELAELGKRLHTIATSLKQQREMEEETRRAAEAPKPMEVPHEDDEDGVSEGITEGKLEELLRPDTTDPEAFDEEDQWEEAEMTADDEEDKSTQPMSEQFPLRKNAASTRLGQFGTGFLYGSVVIPLVTGWVAIREAWKALTDLGKAWFGVANRLWGSWFSFKALNKSIDDVGGSSSGGGKSESKGHDAGHGGGDHGGHGDHGGGHDDHAGDHHAAGAAHHPAGGAHHGGGAHNKPHKPHKPKSKKKKGGGGAPAHH